MTALGRRRQVEPLPPCAKTTARVDDRVDEEGVVEGTGGGGGEGETAMDGGG